MGNNYLNSGESIILTTHSISTDEGLYDVLVTSERIVLVDNSYARFEPRSIPFTEIISVKGGRVPTGEPAITLVLTETGSLADTRDRHLVFMQRPGEDRRHERDLWVKKLIELVVSVRQHTVREMSEPRKPEPGVKPSVRRWVAPDHLLPRTSPEKVPAPARIVVEPDETELPEFLFEESIAAGELPDEEPGNPRDDGTREARALHEPARRRPEEPGQPLPVPFPVLTRSHFSEDSRPPGSPADAAPDIPAGGQSPYTGEADYADDLLAAEENYREAHAEPFSSTVLAAITSLTSAREQQEPAGLPEHPEPEDRPEVPVPEIRTVQPEHPPEVPEEGVPGSEPAQEPEKPDREDGRDGMSPADRHAGTKTPGTVIFPPEQLPAETRPAPGHPVIAEGTPYRGRPPVHGTPAAGQEPLCPARESLPAKRVLPPAALAVLAILILAGVVTLVALFLPPSHGTGVAPVTPAITIPPTVIPAVTEIATDTGVRVRVISPGPFAGTIGNPEFPRQASGSGDISFKVLRNDELVAVTIRKMDNSGSPLTVEIYNNGTLLTSRTVTAPMGEITLLIDPKTGNPPGIAAETAQASGPTSVPTLSYF